MENSPITLYECLMGSKHEDLNDVNTVQKIKLPGASQTMASSIRVCWESEGLGNRRAVRYLAIHKQLNIAEALC